MNFFENQDKARQSTQQLLGLFAIAISIMIVAIYIVVLLLLYILTFSVDTILIIWRQPTLFFWVSVVTISLISLASFYKILCLRQGGCVIAEELGGRLLLTETASEQEQQLLNIVEEMAIASGIPIPKVYLLDREPSINAFAAGLPKAEAASHMFFGNAVKIHFWEEKFATHPPLAVRIRRVGGVQVNNISASSGNIVNCSSSSSVMGFAGSNSHLTPQKVVAQVGKVTPKQFDLTQELLAELPESLRLGIRETQTAQAILFALILDNQNSPLQEKQLTWLRQVQTEELVNSNLTLHEEIAQLNTDIHLPLVDLTIPALRQLSVKECQRVCKCFQGLIAAKEQASVRDFVFRLILWHRLQPVFQPDCNIAVKFNSIQEIWSDCLIVLSVLAQIGEKSAESAAYAFSSGIFQLPGATQQEKPKTPLKCNCSQLKKSIENLRQATPKLKQALVEAVEQLASNLC